MNFILDQIVIRLLLGVVGILFGVIIVVFGLIVPRVVVEMLESFSESME